jgi:general secretion pathway protein D
MTPRIVRLGLAAALAFAALAARAQSPAATAPAAATANPDDELVSLKLPDADIDTVLTSLEALTGRTVLRPAALATATYNFKTPKPMPKSEVVLALETVLMLNGISVAPQGDKFLVVTQLANARSSSPEMLTGSAFDQPASGKIATKLFQLEFLRVNDVLPLMQGMLNQQLLGSVVLPTANSVLITDTVSNLQRLEALLRTLDQPNTAGLTPKFYQLHSAKAADVVTRLRSIFQPLQQQLGTATTYNSDDRTNQIILISDPRQYPLFDSVIAKLDDSAAEPDIHNEVIYLKNAVATKIVTVISQLVSGQIAAAQRANAQNVRIGQGQNQPTPLIAAPQPAGPNTPAAPAPANLNLVGPTTLDLGGASTSNAFSSLASAFADERSNSIIVTGTSQDIRLIRDVIDKLDIILPQVRIEVVIAEVTLDDQATSGISALGLQVDGDKLVGFGAAAAGASISGTLGGTDFATITRNAGNLDLAGVVSLTTTPRKSNSTILTVPSVVTSHGNQAKFFDGETRPVVTGSTSTPNTAGSATTSSQVTQQEIGTTLTVTPFIGNDGTVQLNLDQNVSDVTGQVTVDGNTQYVIGTRKTTQYVTAKSGEIIVLGGFRKKTDSKSTSRLGAIPIIGDLFGTRTRQNRHQELVFFLRPTILTNSPHDNTETMKHVDQLPTRDEIRREIDPNYVAPKESIFKKLLPK